MHTLTWEFTTNPAPECDQHGPGVNQIDCWQHPIDVATCRLTDDEGTELDQDGFNPADFAHVSAGFAYDEIEKKLRDKHGLHQDQTTVVMPG